MYPSRRSLVQTEESWVIMFSKSMKEGRKEGSKHVGINWTTGRDLCLRGIPTCHRRHAGNRRVHCDYGRSDKWWATQILSHITIYIIPESTHLGLTTNKGGALYFKRFYFSFNRSLIPQVKKDELNVQLQVSLRQKWAVLIIHTVLLAWPHRQHWK